MRRSAVAADILDVIAACLGDRCREYEIARTRGVPPADCASITASWINRSVTGFEDCADGFAPCTRTGLHGLRIVITGICMGPDGQPAFDWALEDTVAACFDDDVDAIEQCLECADWSQLLTDHGLSSIRYASTTYDIESEGGGFSAYIELHIDSDECC